MVASPGLASIASTTRSETGFRNAQMRFNQVVRLGGASALEALFGLLAMTATILTERQNEAAKEISPKPITFAAARPSPRGHNEKIPNLDSRYRTR